MRTLILNTIGLLGFGLMVASCEKTEGTLYTPEANKFAFLSTSMNLLVDGDVIRVPITRTTADGEGRANVSLSATGAGYTDVFTVANPVVFAPGEFQSQVEIRFGDLTTIEATAFTVQSNGLDVDAGLAFPVTLNIAETDASPSKAIKMDVFVTNLIEFEDYGTADLNSLDGWGGEVLEDLPLQRALIGGGAVVYKILSPFGRNSIAFKVDADSTVHFPNQVIDLDSRYGPVSMVNVKGAFVDGELVLSVGGYNVAAGSFGEGMERLILPAE